MSEPGATTPSAFLDDRRPIVPAPPSLYGFGGLHGGLVPGRLVAAMAELAGDRQLGSLFVQLHDPVRGDVAVEPRVRRDGPMLIVDASGYSNGRHAVTAMATFAPADAQLDHTVAPASPAAGRPHDHGTFAVPTEVAPIAAHFEIRPVGHDRPYAGGTAPELTAWVRLTDDEQPPDLARLAVLSDALAPSFAATLTVPRPIPTVELTLRPGGLQTATTSPWVLVRAVTTSATAHGWIDERIDAWGVDGRHLVVAHQLRTVRARRRLAHTSAPSGSAAADTEEETPR